jgi:16S rRNA (cytidine1402-2'-O)-methyltransferase
MTGVLSIIATPIGNMEDITLRALRVLGEADVILCEDTRVTRKLLEKYDIHTKTMRYDAHSTEKTREDIDSLLLEGKNIALVSDAGTPGISDPGIYLVEHVRERFADEVRIEAIPGASALTAALSIAGIAAPQFLFMGFLPHKKGRQTLFEEIAESERAVVFYESPHRIMKTLESLAEYVPERTISLARELTKIHEEYVHGTPEEVILYLEEYSDHIRGEFVVIVSGT